jgi:hypothetical protein
VVVGLCVCVCVWVCVCVYVCVYICFLPFSPSIWMSPCTEFVQTGRTCVRMKGECLCTMRLMVLVPQRGRGTMLCDRSEGAQEVCICVMKVGRF